MSEDEEGAAAEAEAGAAEALPPRVNPELLGQEAAEAGLLGAWRSGRLPHAWLLTGPRGIGKATLAFRFARFLLAHGAAGDGLFAPAAKTLAVAPDHPVFRRVASGGHPDLLVVERGYDPQRRRQRSEIVVADTRGIAAFLHLTPAEAGWRVVILDGADLMNRNAANAVLKILEEPPPRALLMLLSDNRSRLLPTIRSRCRHLALRPLPQSLIETMLRDRRPDLASGDAAMLAALAEGSIGRALALASADGLALYRSLVRLIASLPDLDGETLHVLGERLARRGAEGEFTLLGELLPGWLARLAKRASGGTALAILPEEEAAMTRLAGLRPAGHWAEVREDLARLFAETEAINLDRKQVVLNAFFALGAAAR